MNQLQAYIKNENTAALFENTSIGIEKEGHRVTPEGQIAQTPHPQRVDGSSENQYIQRDFAESQTELVSPLWLAVKRVCSSGCTRSMMSPLGI